MEINLLIICGYVLFELCENRGIMWFFGWKVGT